MRNLVFATAVILFLLIIGLRPSPRGWTEQRTGAPTPTATVQAD